MRTALLVLVLVTGAAPLVDAQAAPQAPKDKPAGTAISDEIERLRREIESETRSNVELQFDGHTETGELNDKLGFLRFGVRLNLSRGEGSTLRFTVLHTPYTTEDGVIKESATSLGVGGLGRRSEAIRYEWEVGAVRFSNDRWDGTGLLRLMVRSSDTLRYSIGVSRTLVEESMLSTVGLQPVTGPFAGERVGAVTDNRLAAATTWQLPARAEVVAEGALGVYTGRNTGTNFFRRFGGGPAWNAIARAPDSSLSFLRVGAWFEYFGYEEDRLGYGGASLIDSRGQPVPPEELGSDGISPDPDPPHPGVGGYFSPDSFTSLVGQVELRGRPSPGLEYAVSAFLGRQSYTGVEARNAGGISLNVKLRLAESVSLPLSYVWDDYGPFTQQTLRARLVIRF